MMRRGFFVILLSLGLLSGLRSQIQNINISGTFSGTFLVSGSGNDYQIAGSAYLSETWMFGALEMKGDIIKQAKREKKVRTQMSQYQQKLSKINVLIDKLSDPEQKAIGLSISMSEINPDGEKPPFDVRIFNSDFQDFSGITKELQDKLLFYLEQLKAEYESEINEFYKINGLFRYNLYAQEFEMIYGKDTFSIVSPFDLKSISISNKKFIHGLYVKRGGSRVYLGSSYFEVLSEGNCKLLMRHDVKIKSGGGPVTYNWAGGGDAFVQYQQFYYQQSEGDEVIILRKRKQDILELFADRSEDIEKFIRLERINVRDDASLIKVFNYYNSLDI